jgi:hypothetical protein
VAEFEAKYVLTGRPVLLFGDGLLAGTASAEWARGRFLRRFGATPVSVGNSSQQVPEQVYPFRNYTASTFNMQLHEFVDTALAPAPGRTGVAADREATTDPLYLFRRLQLPELTSAVTEPKYFKNASLFSWSPEKRKQKFIFSIGPVHSGLFFHQHAAAYNAVVYGAKRWFLFPANSYYGPEYVTTLQWLRTAMPTLPVQPLECTQEAGDILFVPQGWHHAVINLADTLAAAVEIGYMQT